MTNREWLNSLSDDDFAVWCLEGDVFNYETTKCEPPTPRLYTIRISNTSSLYGLKEWLKQERLEDDKI